MDAAATLATIAQVATAFIGFTGVIFAVGRFSTGAWSIQERNALVALLMPSLFALFLSFVPMVASSSMSAAPLWRISNGLLAIIHAPLVTRALWQGIRSELIEPNPLRFFLIPVGYFSVIVSTLVAFGHLQGWAVAAFTGGLVWFLFVAAIQFVMLIIPHPVIGAPIPHPLD